MSRQLAEEQRGGVRDASSTAGAAVLPSGGVDVTSLLQPSSFSSTLASHPFLAAAPTTPTASSTAAVTPMFPNAPAAAAAAAAASSSLLSSPARSSQSLAIGSPAATTRSKRSSDQFDATHALDAGQTTRQSKITRTAESDEDEGDAEQMDDEEGEMRAEARKSRTGAAADEKAKFAPDDEGQPEQTSQTRTLIRDHRVPSPHFLRVERASHTLCLDVFGLSPRQTRPS